MSVFTAKQLRNSCHKTHNTHAHNKRLSRSAERLMQLHFKLIILLSGEEKNTSLKMEICLLQSHEILFTLKYSTHTISMSGKGEKKSSDQLKSFFHRHGSRSGTRFAKIFCDFHAFTQSRIIVLLRKIIVNKS